jgi:hypothetical protein
MAWSIYLACENRRLKAVSVFILALLFHFSVVVSLPLLVLLLLGVKFRSRIWVLSLVPVGVIASIGMSRMVTSLGNFYRISEYIGGMAGADAQAELSWYMAAHILTIAICLFMFWDKMSLHQRVAVLCCGFGILLFEIFGAYKTLAVRCLYLFDLYWLFILVEILEKMKGKRRLVFTAAFAVTGFVLFYMSLQNVQRYSTFLSALSTQGSLDSSRRVR